ncbi:MAG: hypothetical protein MZV64_43165 [Ignavibacteriales bacterium]|nr:hypothetical protein [Ignavibacteriales bacterium]
MPYPHADVAPPHAPPRQRRERPSPTSAARARPASCRSTSTTRSSAGSSSTPRLDIDAAIARSPAGVGWRDRSARSSQKAWALAEEAVIWRSRTPRTLYSTIGFTWYRLWARPFVPNIEAIPPAERAYYEDFMCTTPHNPNNVDLSRDVLFHARSTPAQERAGPRAHGRPRVAAARRTPSTCSRRAGGRRRGARRRRTSSPTSAVRLRALRCWIDDAPQRVRVGRRRLRLDGRGRRRREGALAHGARPR